MLDFLVVGAGLYGATFARLAAEAGYSVLVVDKRNYVGGNAYTENVGEICVHKHGPHIFHTDDEWTWSFVNRFGEFEPFINTPIACRGHLLYNLPFNMNTFVQIFGIRTPDEARAIIDKEKADADIREPKNLEEKAISMVGATVYQTLVKDYTEKQWGRPCSELPTDTISRLPLRFTFDNSYYNDKYQAIPIHGYTELVKNMLSYPNIELRLGCGFQEAIDDPDANIARMIIYSGAIDELFDYVYGHLEYRTLHFEERVENCENYQGVAVMNFPDASIPYTRRIEHKHFAKSDKMLPYTVITEEYSKAWFPGDAPYYPIRDKKNLAIYDKYARAAELCTNIVFGGRLGTYKYLDMDDTIMMAKSDFDKIAKTIKQTL